MEDANAAKRRAEVKQISFKETYLLTSERTIYFRVATGSLLYLSRGTRPDLTFSGMILSRSMSYPGKRAMMKLTRVLRYLRVLQSLVLHTEVVKIVKMTS